jgi:carbon-monoxide dehydrogenase large subunit
MPFLAREGVAAVLGVPEEQLRVIAPDVGGGFGAKAFYREDALAAHLSMRLGRPVKWVATRVDDMLSTLHARDMVSYAEAAVAGDGRILGLRVRTLANVGAYLLRHGPLPPLRMVNYPTGAYRIEHLDAEVLEVLTNTVPTGPYRGAGRPEATFLIERVVDAVAMELGMDPAEVRRRNFIPPDQFPYRTAGGVTYDSGNYARALDLALEMSDYPRLRREQAERRARGELVGIGLATYVEVSGGGWESGVVRLERGGTVTAITGASPHGQGHETTFSQVIADVLGVSPEQVTVQHGDTAIGPPGTGTFGSRSVLLGGSALHRAASEVRDALLRMASQRLEVAPEDLVLEHGGVHLRGVPDRAVSLRELAEAAYGALAAPTGTPGQAISLRASAERVPEVNGAPNGLEARVKFQAEGDAFPFGAYVAAVRVDPETARVEIERLVAVDDCGNAVNPLLVEGQLHGAIAQGLGETLLEEIVYDESGQILTSTLMDYAAPKADDMPPLAVDRTVTPSPFNPLGAKGVGEAGTVGSPPAIANAIVDALSPLGVRHLDVPITSERLWRVLVERTADRRRPTAEAVPKPPVSS